MSSIKDKSTNKPLSDKRQAFVDEYRINGHNATQAYKTAYPGCKSGHRQAGQRLLTFVDIGTAIRKARAKQAEKAETTVESVHNLYQSAYDQASGINQPSAMVSAATGIARLYGMDKDAAVKEDKPDSLTPEQVEEYRAMARAAIKLRLA